jgi:hypothetical protein
VIVRPTDWAALPASSGTPGSLFPESDVVVVVTAADAGLDTLHLKLGPVLDKVIFDSLVQ